MKAREGVMKSELFGDGTFITFIRQIVFFGNSLENQFSYNSATYLLPFKKFQTSYTYT